MTDLVVTQIGNEAWLTASATPLRATQIAANAWGFSPAPPLRASQIGVEVWVDVSDVVVLPANPTNVAYL